MPTLYVRFWTNATTRLREWIADEHAVDDAIAFSTDEWQRLPPELRIYRLVVRSTPAVLYPGEVYVDARLEYAESPTPLYVSCGPELPPLARLLEQLREGDTLNLAAAR